MNASGVREVLARHGLALHRGRGQNFLIDAGLADRLATLSRVGPEDTVIEIGTGLGILTRALAARARRVVTIEVDAGLVRALRAEALLPPEVELLHADALEVDLAALARRAGGARVRVVANLPYAISAPLLRRLLDLRGALVDWSVMLQRDVADRLLAGPGSRDYGSLSVLHQLAVSIERTQQLESGCFYPVPRVRSAFLRMVPHARPCLREGELPCVERVVRAAFSTRRKMLVNALRGAGIGSPGRSPADALARAGLPPGVRAEALRPDQLLALSRALADGGA
jgi:16S rRNA (adenine1518-N6/adenine1519-N6)-dimethyltransferase